MFGGNDLQIQEICFPWSCLKGLENNLILFYVFVFVSYKASDWSQLLHQIQKIYLPQPTKQVIIAVKKD